MPTGLAVTGTTTTSISLSWNASSGAASHQLYRNGVQVYSVANTCYADGGLASNTSYSYTVRATSTAGSTSVSVVVTGTTLRWAPWPPGSFPA